MTATKSVDVLVVGARCAGAATAMLMARRGLRVLAIDRNDYGSDTISTHALMRGGVLQLARWGAPSRLRDRGTPAIRNTTFHYGDDVLDVAIRPAHGIDALYAPRRTILDSLLVDMAWESGAEIKHRHTLIDLVRHTNGQICGAIIADAAGNLTQVRADLVVGADGVGSSVARLADVPMTRQAHHATAVVFGYFPGVTEAGYQWHYRSGVSVGAIPTNADQHCVFVAIPPDQFRRTPWRTDRASMFHQTLQHAVPELAATIHTSLYDTPLHVFAGHKGYFRPAVGPGWALVGDAGYFKDPITAHGITDALRDAELLANAAALGNLSAFADFAATRDALSRPLFEATDEIASFDWTFDRLQELHQTLNRTMKQEVNHLLTLGGVHHTTPLDHPTLIQEKAA
ncbi:MAG: NAD(P)/FAD-dependent oxidoreductase [Acetobacteraceae bacterium]